MSTDQVEVKPLTIKKFPFILNKKIVLKKGASLLKNNIKVVKAVPSSIQEDIIYVSQPGDFTSGEYRSVTLVNRLNTSTNVSKTVAKCQSHSEELYEKTSEDLTKLIGQNNYDILFSSLCSILNQELKIRSINSLLTVPKQFKSISCQTDIETLPQEIEKLNLKSVDSAVQTDESCLKELKASSLFLKRKRRTKRGHLVPYVVKDTPATKKGKRVVISPKDFETIFLKENDTKQESHTSLPELSGSVFADEDSNSSLGKFSALSVSTTPDLLTNPMKMIMTNVDKHTKDISCEIKCEMVATETEDYNVEPSDSPIRPDPLDTKGTNNMSSEERIKLLIRQGLNDWKCCMMPDNNGHLPIHVAVLSKDAALLRRQCVVLRMRSCSVDLPADGLTPLKMSLYQDNTQLTSVLLEFGADPLDTDDDDRTAFHIAAEMQSEHLHVLVNHCQQNARKVLQDNEELWKPEFENKSDEELSKFLLTYINKSYDHQGYTPLMLASKLGRYNNVLALVEHCKEAVNIKMPNSGNTALYLAVGAACMDSAERGNKTKIVDHFKRTVEILVENGADPGVENFAGSSVNDLLTECYVGELSMLIANKLTNVRYFNNQLPSDVQGANFILIKDEVGKVNVKELINERKYKKGIVSKDFKVNVVNIKAKPELVDAKNFNFMYVKEEGEIKIKDIVNEKRKRKDSPVILQNVTFDPKLALPSQVSTSTALPSQVSPVNLGIVKQENTVNASQSFTPIVKNFKLNKPVVIQSTQTSNNKRKLEIVVDTSETKKPNKSD